MRAFFLLCFALCTVAVTAPMASDARMVTAVVPASAIRPGATAVPSEVIVPVAASPAATSSPAPEARQNPIVKPKGPVPAVAPPTPVPTAVATPKPTVKPKASAPIPTKAPTAKPTATPTRPPSGSTTYTRDQVIAGIRSGWGGNDDKAIAVADCESGLNPRASSSGGTYLGLWQFHIETWRSYGGSGDPRDHSPHVQTQVAWRVFADHGWGAWPGCE